MALIAIAPGNDDALANMLLDRPSAEGIVAILPAHAHAVAAWWNGVKPIFGTAILRIYGLPRIGLHRSRKKQKHKRSNACNAKYDRSSEPN